MGSERFRLIFIVAAFWLSSWIPLPLNAYSGAVILGCLVALLGSRHLASKPGTSSAKLARITRFGAILLSVGGLLLAVVLSLIETPASVAIFLFSILGWAAFILLLSDVVASARRSGSGLGTGVIALLILAAWSWLSAASMYVHRGAERTGASACILVPGQIGRYDEKITSIWDMRLPAVISASTGPTGTTILDYHAILVVPDGATVIYNWSKTWMRFEALDRQRNPYLPDECPA